MRKEFTLDLLLSLIMLICVIALKAISVSGTLKTVFEILLYLSIIILILRNLRKKEKGITWIHIVKGST